MARRFSPTKSKQARRDKGYGLRTFARELGVRHPRVCAWEAGKWAPVPARAAQMAQVLGVEVDALYEDDEVPA